MNISDFLTAMESTCTGRAPERNMNILAYMVQLRCMHTDRFYFKPEEVSNFCPRLLLTDNMQLSGAQRALSDTTAQQNPL